MRRLVAAAILCLLLLCLYHGTSFSGLIYKWVDENGVVHFTDSLPDKSLIKDSDVKVRRVQDYEEPPTATNEQIKQNRAQEANRVEALKEQQKPQGESSDYGKRLKDLEEQKALLQKVYEKQTREVQEQNARIKKENARLKKAQKRNPDTKQRSTTIIPVPSKQPRKTVKPQNAYPQRAYDKEKRAYQRRQQEIENRQREYDKKLREYEQKKREVDQYNAKVRKHNRLLEQKKYIEGRKKAAAKYHKRRKQLHPH